MGEKCKQSDIVFVFKMLAFFCEGTFTAVGISCTADVAAEVDYTVAVVGLLLGWDDFTQDFLHFRSVLYRFGVVAEAAVDSDAVSVRYNAGDAENIAKYQIRDFSAYTGELQETVH